MPPIFVITVSGKSRIPARTQYFLNQLENLTPIEFIGVDMRNLNYSEISSIHQLKLAEFVVGGPLST